MPHPGHLIPQSAVYGDLPVRTVTLQSLTCSYGGLAVFIIAHTTQTYLSTFFELDGVGTGRPQVQW